MFDLKKHHLPFHSYYPPPPIRHGRVAKLTQANIEKVHSVDNSLIFFFFFNW